MVFEKSNQRQRIVNAFFVELLHEFRQELEQKSFSADVDVFLAEVLLDDYFDLTQPEIRQLTDHLRAAKGELTSFPIMLENIRCRREYSC